MGDEGKLRRDVEQALAKVVGLRDRYAETQDERTGRALLTAREKASESLRALWKAFPDEKPPTQTV